MHSTEKEPRLFFELSGGLGNQLFQYFAGKFLKAEKSVGYKVAPYQSAAVSQGLRKFNIGELSVLPEMKRSSISNFVYRFYRYLLRRSSLIRGLAFRYLRVYQSQVVGFDEDFPKSSKVEKVYGYFQSFLYVPIEIHSRGLLLTKLSQDVSNLVRELVAADPIVIHIRGGDYRGLAKSVGILSSDYYERALELILAEKPGKAIWLFSNDPELADQILESTPLKISRRILETDLGPEETLFLMSQANHIVISNSTFSWWAAYLRGSNKFVVAPTKWFRTLEEPKNLIPQKWLRVESSWLL